MANQTVEVIRDASLQRGRERVAALAKGRKLFVTKDEGAWAGTTIIQGGKQESGWVQIASLKPLPGEPRAYKHVQNAGGSFLSAAMLIQKAKQFDDGLYAAADLAAENGQGDMPAKSQLLREWPAKVDGAAGGKGLTVLLAAGQLGGSGAEVPAAQKKAVADLLAAFNRDEKRSKPLGFYTWSKALEAIFRQDRMLQTPLEESDRCAGHCRGAEGRSGAVSRVSEAIAARLSPDQSADRRHDVRPFAPAHRHAGDQAG